MNYLSKQQQEDLLVTALEGGSNYWYLINVLANPLIAKGRNNVSVSEHIFNLIQKGENITINDVENEDEVLGSLNLNSIKTGTELMQSDAPLSFAQILSEDWDANTADIWFQYCVMGEVIFG